VAKFPQKLFCGLDLTKRFSSQVCRARCTSAGTEMGKALIIAEKPSVAGDIARALGGFKKVDDFYESDQYVVSSAVGHLLTIVPPEGVEAARGKWTFKHLPVIPPHFDLLPIEKSEPRLKVLKKLISALDVDALINACDAGREGELIFRNIVRFTKAKQPIKRLWLQSMTPAAIREGFAQLREDKDMLPLADAAYSRSEADWLVGINGTRAMTAFNSKLGGFFKTTVGRVQTPTLAIVVEREARIRKFVSRDFWEVIGTFDARRGNTPDAGSTKNFPNPTARTVTTSSSRSASGTLAVRKALQEKCLGKPGIVTEESKPSTSLSPLLYDLTSLQARRELAVWVFREEHARPGAGALRTAQGADVSAHRLAGVAGGLHRHGEKCVEDARRNRLRGICRNHSPEQLGASEQTHLQQRQGFRPLRHHSDHADRRTVCPSRNGSCTTW